MNESSFWMRFALAVLATWRITHLVAREDGPADLLARARARLGRSVAGKLMDCFQCLTLWVSVPMAFFVGGNALHLVLTWLALSGAACVLERVAQGPVVMQPIAPIEGDNHDGLLRSNPNNPAEQPAADDDRRARRTVSAE